MPLVIAAHPNGREYPQYTEFFKGRKVIFGSTAELVFGSNIVISHFSSALSFAVLLRKKILLLSATKLKGTIPGMMINYISSQLRCLEVNMDEVLCQNSLSEFNNMTINELSYHTYEKNYIINTSTPGRDPYENLLKYLRSFEL